MNIAMFADTFIPDNNGVATSIQNTINYLSSKGHKVVIFAPGEGYSKKKILGADVFTIKSDKSSLLLEYKCPKFVPKKIKEIFIKYKFDIVHVHTPFVIGWTGVLLAKSYNVPLVGTYHTNFDMLFDFYAKNKIIKIMKKVFLKSIKIFHENCDILISPSKTQTRTLIKQGYKKLITISNPVDLSAYKKVKSMRKKLGIPEKAKVALYVGRISKEKKISELIKAFESIYKEDRYLVIGGKGPHLDYFRDFVNEKQIKNVIFSGYIAEKDIVKFYSSADVFVSMSDFETHGLTFIEAMACGIPCVGVNAGGVADSIEHLKNGFLVKPNNSAEFGKKIEVLFEDKNLHSKMSSYALKSCDECSIENAGREIESLYMSASKYPVEKTSFVKFWENVLLKSYTIPAEAKIIFVIALMLAVLMLFNFTSSAISGDINIETVLSLRVIKEVLSNIISKI
ncbi:MAG: glycosyltransferase [Candidatus Nanoarchaeia archaeon]|nr:glycosyltransferase [Candidatus Nanoarchaeia archaeon]